MMTVEQYLEAILGRMGTVCNSMERAFERPEFVEIHGHREFRYRQQTESLACFLKGVKLVSTLNASVQLLKGGFIQEMGALCRMLDDLKNEITFLLVPLDGKKYSDSQMEFLRDFFQEELNDPQPIKSTQKRKSVPARKVHAGVAKISSTVLNPSDSQALLERLNKSYSGYVHGAYPHIMELYGGSSRDSLHFHMNGVAGSPVLSTWSNQLAQYVYRAACVLVLVAKKLGLELEEQKFRKLVELLENQFGFDPKASPAEAMRKMKAT